MVEKAKHDFSKRESETEQYVATPELQNKLSLLAIIQPESREHVDQSHQITLEQNPNKERSEQINPGDAQQKNENYQLIENEKGHARYFQSQRLLPALPKITKLSEEMSGKSQEERTEAWYKSLKIREEIIKKEYLQDNPWGPESRAAMEDYLALINMRTKSALQAFESYGKELPEGNVLTIPDENGKRVSLEDYSSRVLSSQLRFELKDLSKAPTESEFWKMELQNKWLAKVEAQLQSLRLDDQDRRIATLIDERKLPDSWNYKEGMNRAGWRHTVSRLIDLALDTGSQIDIIQQLALPVKLPEGTKLSKRDRGRLNIAIDLPLTPDLDDPVNIQKIESLETWRKQSGQKIQEALKGLAELSGNPISVISLGDLVLPASKSSNGESASTIAVFNDKKQLVLLADPFTFEKAPGQSTEPVNLLEQRPEVEADAEGNVKVRMHVQAQRVPWFSPQNMIYENVGEPAELEAKTFIADELVAVQNKGKTEFLLAKDLKTHFERMKVQHYADKGIAFTLAAMDLAMLATGTIEVAAAIKGARLLAAGNEALSALGLSTKASKGALDFSLGITGPLTNAHWSSFESGQSAGHIRGMIFLGMASMGPAQSLAQLGNYAKSGARKALGIPESTASLQSFYEKQQNAARFHELIKSSGKIVETASDYASKVMLYGQLPVGLLVGYELTKQLRELYHLETGNLRQAMIKDKPSLLQSNEYINQTSRKDLESQEQRTARMQSYVELFELSSMNKTGVNLEEKQINKNEEPAREIRRIFEMAEKAQQPETDPDTAQRLANELAKSLSFNQADIQKLEVFMMKELSSEQLDTLRKTEAADLNRNEPTNSRKANELAAQIMNNKNKSSVAAASLGLLNIMAQKHNIKEALAKTQVWTSNTARLFREHELQSRFEKQAITKLMMQYLRPFEKDGRGLVLTDALIRSGELQPAQFAPVLSHLLENPEISAAEKSKSIQLALEFTGSFENSFPKSKMQATLARAALSDSDSSVRALASALYYILGESGKTNRTGNLGAINTEFANRIRSFKTGKPDSKAEEGIVELLSGQLSNHKDFSEQKLALETLSLLLPHMNSPEKTRVEEKALASISKVISAEKIHEANGLFSAFAMINCSGSSAGLQLIEEITNKSISMLQTSKSYDPVLEHELILLNQNIVNMLSILSNNKFNEQSKPGEKLISQYISKAAGLIKDSNISYTALASHLLESVAKLNCGDELIDLLKSSSKSSSTRLRSMALQSLIEISRSSSKDQEISAEQIIALFKSETDPGIVQSLENFKNESGADANPEAELNPENFVESIAQLDREILLRYPDLKNFDLESQKEWVSSFYPLILRSNYVSELENVVKAERSVLSSSRIQEKCQRLAAQREIQFEALKTQAAGPIELPLTRWARVVLSTISSNERNPFTIGSESLLIGWRKETPFNELEMHSELAQNRRSPVYYRQAERNWSLQAEGSLRESTELGRSGIDLSRRLLKKIRYSKASQEGLK